MCHRIPLKAELVGKFVSFSLHILIFIGRTLEVLRAELRGLESEGPRS